MAKDKGKLGLWLIGACGGVAATAAVGIEAIRRLKVEPLGLIGHLPPFDRLRLASLDRWVVGGHEIRETSFQAAADEMASGSHGFDRDLATFCRPWLRQCQKNLRPGTATNCGKTIAGMADWLPAERRVSGAEIVERLADDIRDFARRNRLERVIVINVSSTEPPFKPGPVHQRWSTLSKKLAARSSVPLPASSLYALAAIEVGASYINFTPSVGIDVPALRELARERSIGYMGCDGKTGETLMKSVLAPMFRDRNFPVRSWVGHNIFGNRDGQVLDDPKNKAAKTKSKDHLVHQILGYHPKTLVSIEYIESMGDWKTAWDHIHFEGFLGTRMVLQFIWQGCDSILAAPLVIELARFAELSARRGETGALTHLASFFKSPMDVEEQGFGRQFETLLAYARGHA